MSQETELKLSLRPQDVRRLLSHPLLRQQTPERQRLFNTYFDTPQLTLMGQRIAVRERRIGRRTWLTVKTAGSTQGGLSRRGEWEGPTRPGEMDFVTLVDDTHLAQTLSGVARQLTPLFRTDFLRLSWQLEYAGAHIEVALDRGHIAVGHGPDMPTDGLQQKLLELELELKSGPVDALLDLAHTLALGPQGEMKRGLWLYPSARSKAERGLALFLGQQPEPVKAGPVQLTDRLPPVEAFRTTALACLAHWQANVGPWLEGAADQPVDPEFVHQARVALRRLRTGLRLFKPALPPRFFNHWNARWQLTARALGEVRNWDVLATEGWAGWLGPMADNPSLQPVHDWIQTQRQQANQRARSCLHEPAHALDLLAFSQAVLALPTAARPPHSKPLSRWALRRLQGHHRQLLIQTRKALGKGPKGRHALRIALKKLRYAQELLGDLLPERSQRDTARLVKAQSLLGELNDLSTAQALLADCPLDAAATVSTVIDARLKTRLHRLRSLERALLRSRAPGA
ncbi:CYTH and CHAD domain-containing protein [Hydrogenophaga sp.]|uniref:CYTH and CHAD domain-containing protein n=1 Tax=Hydrogenophaga sp. TaxID=1904254 RepID=UPI0025C08D68|nr:CYTH and CHAD domain-containing protein [Hydrogenophaga sp.]